MNALASCRTGFRIYTLNANYNFPVPTGVIAYPNLALIGSIRIPYNCAVVGYSMSTAGTMVSIGLVTYATFVVVGQSTPSLTVSPAITAIGSHLSFMRAVSLNKFQQTSSVFFKRAAYEVAANQPISLYASKAITTDVLIAVCSLYVVAAA